jgi:hypothetical protein
MDYIFDRIVFSFATKGDLLLSDEEFASYDKFIDNEIDEGGLDKYSKYGFVGTGLAEKINNRLPHESKIIALETSDKRINIRAKGQAAYFLAGEEVAILTFSLNAITFFKSINNNS